MAGASLEYRLANKAIHDVLGRIDVQDAALGLHLARSVRTGLYCTYDPDPKATPRWTF